MADLAFVCGRLSVASDYDDLRVLEGEVSLVENSFH